VKALVRLALDRVHAGLTVSQAAIALRISERTLRRRLLRWTSFPPKTILDLARVSSVATHLLRRDDALETIAREHGFAHAASMSRVFREFVGLRPGAYRERFVISAVAENGIKLAENSNRSQKQGTVHSRHHDLYR